MYTILQFSFVDSHHKLIRWRFITHGNIDGYSRLILYLQCCTNNRVSTVYELFLKAAQEYHLPSRVRCDQGLENVAVARHMIEKRGAERRKYACWKQHSQSTCRNACGVTCIRVLQFSITGYSILWNSRNCLTL